MEWKSYREESSGCEYKGHSRIQPLALWFCGSVYHGSAYPRRGSGRAETIVLIGADCGAGQPHAKDWEWKRSYCREATAHMFPGRRNWDACSQLCLDTIQATAT